MVPLPVMVLLVNVNDPEFTMPPPLGGLPLFHGVQPPEMVRLLMAVPVPVTVKTVDDDWL